MEIVEAIPVLHNTDQFLFVGVSRKLHADSRCNSHPS